MNQKELLVVNSLEVSRLAFLHNTENIEIKKNKTPLHNTKFDIRNIDRQGYKSTQTCQ